MARISNPTALGGSVDLVDASKTGYSNQPLEDYLDQLKGKFDLSGKITLIHCPTFSFEAFSTEVAKMKGYYAYPPIGLQCLKAAISGEMGLEAEILDLNFEILERFQTKDEAEQVSPGTVLVEILDEYFHNNNVSIVGVSAGVVVSNVFGVEKHPFVQVLEYLKEKERQLVIAGGVIATNEGQGILRRELAHFVFKGEAEDELTFFMKKLVEGDAGRPLSGICFKSEGTIHETAGDVSVVDFNWNLVETYKDIPIERYHQVGSLSPFSRMLGTDRIYSTIHLNRGCRANCSFCGVIPFVGKGVRAYPAESVISEIRYLAQERGVQHLEWLDDDLLRYRDTLIQILKQMTEDNLNLTWAANNGVIAAALDEELLQIMIDSGCMGFRIGVESGNEEMLRKIKKPASRKTLKKSSEMFAKFPDLFVVGCYIIGFDDETNKQMLDTFQFCNELDLSWSGFSICQEIRDSTNVTEEFDASYTNIIDFVPTKTNSSGIIANAVEFDVRKHFESAGDEVHEKDYLDEIWFAFNLLSNYVNNKNLKAGGRPDQFVQWSKALQLSHPSNAIISLFLSLGAILDGDDELAQEQWGYTESLLNDSEYWMKRFRQYSVDEIMNNRPMIASDVYERLEAIRDEYHSVMFA